MHRQFPCEYGSERILKIAFHLPKLWPKIEVVVFLKQCILNVYTALQVTPLACIATVAGNLQIIVMSQRPPAHYPVTGVCIVSDPQKCPPGYDIVRIVFFCPFAFTAVLHLAFKFTCNQFLWVSSFIKFIVTASCISTKLRMEWMFLHVI